jgi:hypothetical protein
MIEKEQRMYTCPLCRKQFAGADCHTSCGVSFGCTMVRCPNCSYEFVEEGAIANLLRKVFGLRPPTDGSSPG